MTQVRGVLLARHDALQLYHPLWARVVVQLVPAGGPWGVDPPRCRFEVPADFTPDELSSFVEKHWGAVVAAAGGVMGGRE